MVTPLPLSLIEAFGYVPDPRSSKGRRHPLPNVLALVAMGIMCGCRSVYAVLQWGRDQRTDMAAKLGLQKHGIPTDGMMSNLMRRLDLTAYESALQRWVAAWPADAKARMPEVINIDGKTLRGTRGHSVPGVHLLAAYAARLGLVIKQVPAAATQDQGGEITAALTLLEGLVLQGKVITGDAIHAQRDLCAKVMAQHGDYLLTVKGNQERLQAELVDLFRSPCDPLLHSNNMTSTGHAPSNAPSGSAPNWPGGVTGRDSRPPA